LCALQALKRVLPGEPADGKLRPYLPSVTKQAWHLDKQSLGKGKGVKRQKVAAAATVLGPEDAAAAAAAVAAAAAAAAGSKENEQQQPLHAGQG